MRSVCKTLTIFVFVCTSWMSTAYGQGETRFTVVDSSPTSWVARGLQNYTVSPDLGWTFTPSRNGRNGIGFWISGQALPGTSIDYWWLEFAAPFDAELTPGVYADFQRYPFQDADRPGLWFASTGRGDNMAAGTFEVLDATYGPDGEVLSFAADFIHYGETILDRWAIVEIRYNYVEDDAPVEVEVDIDIKLDDPENVIQLGKRKPKPLDVVLFGDDRFDVNDILVETLALGDPAIDGGTASPPVDAFVVDVNGDGFDDLSLSFDLAAMESSGAIDSSSVGLVLDGMFSNGDFVIGSDLVTIRQPGSKGKANGKGNGI